MQTFKLKIQNVRILHNALSHLKGFTKIDFKWCKIMQRNVNSLQQAIDEHENYVKLWQERYEAEIIKDEEGKVVNTELQKSLIKELNDLNINSLYEVNLQVLKASIFPQDTKDFGTKEVTLNNGSTVSISYLECMLDLLDVLVVEDEDYDDYIAQLKTQELIGQA